MTRMPLLLKLFDLKVHPPANKKQSVSENEQKGRGAKLLFCLGEGKEKIVGGRDGIGGRGRVLESSKMESIALCLFDFKKEKS